MFLARTTQETMGDTATKLDMELDDLVDRGRGGKVRGGRRGRGERGQDGARDEPYRNTAGHRHLKGVTLQDIASAPERDRWGPRKSQQPCCRCRTNRTADCGDCASATGL